MKPNCTLFLIISIFLVTNFASAQSNYKPGYVVTLKGDTLHGFIDYREWDSNPSFINFKNTINDKGRKLTTDDITLFNIFQLEVYQKYTGPISTDITDLNKIADGRDSSFKTASVFLKIIQSGPVLTLYAYADNIKTRFYIKDKDAALPVELIYRVYYDLDHNTNATQSGRTVNENTYLRQLFALAEKYNVMSPALQTNLERSSYNKLDISKIVSEINGVSKQDYNKKLNSESPVQFFLGAALNVTKTSAGGYYQAAGGTNYTSSLPEISFGINIFANPNTQRLVFRAEFMLGEGQYKSDYVNKVSPYIPISYSYHQLSAAIVPQLIFNFYNEENFKVYGGIGIAFTFYKYSNAVFKSQDGKTPTAQIIQDDPYAFSSFDNPLMIKAGVMFARNWGIYGDYLTSAKVTHNDYFASNFTGLQVGLNYFFRK